MSAELVAARTRAAVLGGEAQARLHLALAAEARLEIAREHVVARTAALSAELASLRGRLDAANAVQAKLDRNLLDTILSATEQNVLECLLRHAEVSNAERSPDIVQSLEASQRIEEILVLGTRRQELL